MTVITDLALVDLQDPVDLSRDQLDAVELAAGLDVAEHLALIDDEGDERVAASGAFSGPDKAAHIGGLDIGSFCPDAEAGEEVDGNGRIQTARPLQSVWSLIGARRNNLSQLGNIEFAPIAGEAQSGPRATAAPPRAFQLQSPGRTVRRHSLRRRKSWHQGAQGQTPAQWKMCSLDSPTESSVIIYHAAAGVNVN